MLNGPMSGVQRSNKGKSLSLPFATPCLLDTSKNLNLQKLAKRFNNKLLQIRFGFNFLMLKYVCPIKEEIRCVSEILLQTRHCFQGDKILEKTSNTTIPHILKRKQSMITFYNPGDSMGVGGGLGWGWQSRSK